LVKSRKERQPFTYFIQKDPPPLFRSGSTSSNSASD
jgi:hypothetical protein